MLYSHCDNANINIKNVSISKSLSLKLHPKLFFESHVRNKCFRRSRQLKASLRLKSFDGIF